MILFYTITRLKCKSCARVKKIVVKIDWIVIKSFQMLKNVEKNKNVKKNMKM